MGGCPSTSRAIDGDALGRATGRAHADRDAGGRAVTVDGVVGVKGGGGGGGVDDGAAAARAVDGAAPARAVDGRAVDGAAPARAVDGRAVDGAAPARAVDGRAVDGAAPARAVDGAAPARAVDGRADDGAAPARADDGRADDGAAAARVDDGASPGREPPTREPPAREDAGESPVEREPEASERDAKMIEELRRALSASLPKMPTPMKSASKPSRSGRSDSVREVPKPSPAMARAVSFRLAEDGLKSEELNGSGEENSGERRDRAAALRDVEATAKRTRQELRRQARVAVARDVAAEAGEGEAQVLDVVPPPETLQLPPRASSVKKREGATRWTKPANAYETKLEKLLAIAERAGSNAERVRDEITQLGERVDSLNKPVHVQPWQERGNSWAGDMKSSRRDNSERSSSAGTILNPKNAKSREMRTQFENASSQGEAVSPTTPERPKMVTSVLRSDLLKSMGVMSAEEKLARLGLRSVPEDEGMSSETGTSFARASTAPRRAWNDRVSKAKSNHSDSEYGMMKVSPPPPSLRSQTSKSQARDALDESPTMNYVDQLKAQAKLARAESAKSWKPGRGVKSGAAQL